MERSQAKRLAPLRRAACVAPNKKQKTQFLFFVERNRGVYGS